MSEVILRVCTCLAEDGEPHVHLSWSGPVRIGAGGEIHLPPASEHFRCARCGAVIVGGERPPKINYCGDCLELIVPFRLMCAMDCGCAGFQPAKECGFEPPCSRCAECPRCHGTGCAECDPIVRLSQPGTGQLDVPAAGQSGGTNGQPDALGHVAVNDPDRDYCEGRGPGFKCPTCNPQSGGTGACEKCGHEHAGAKFGGICVGCPCPERHAQAGRGEEEA